MSEESLEHSSEHSSDSEDECDRILEETLQCASSIQTHYDHALAILERLQRTQSTREAEIHTLHKQAMDQIRSTGTSSFGASLLSLFTSLS